MTFPWRSLRRTLRETLLGAMRAPVLLLALSLSGCDLFSGSPDAVLTVAAARPDVALTLRNTGDAVIEVGPLPCTVELEVETDRGWEIADHSPLILCADVLVRLDPGATEEATYPMKGVPNGLYRFHVTVAEAGGGGTSEIVSNEIAVASAES